MVIEVAIGPGGAPGVFRVEVVESPAGEASATVELDADSLLARREQLQQAVLASAVPSRSVLPETERLVREVGQVLFTGLLGTGEVAGRYRASAAIAAERGQGLRVVLRIDSPTLAGLPWEAMYDQATGAYVCRQDQLVRHVPAASVPAPLHVRPPLRILGVVSSPRGLPALDVDKEQDQLARALARPASQGLAQLHWAPTATWADLQDLLLDGEWHVLHFIGHGDFDPGQDEGVLALTREDGRADLVGAHRLVDLLRQARPMPRLVVLKSCSGAAAGASDLFSGTAAALVRGGVSAVAAMQYEISDPAVVAFDRGFYAAIARGRGVDDAVSSGRVAILGLGGRTLEWVTPVLYLRGLETQLFTLPAPADVADIDIPSAARTPEDDDGSAGATLNLEDDDGSARVFVRGRMEPELVVDQPSTVEVVVAGEPIHHVERPTDRGGQAPVVTDQPLLVEVAGRVNLEVTGRDRVEIPVPAPGEPRLLLFEVRATDQGDGELWVIVRQGSLPLLTLVLRPSIRQPPLGVGEARLEAIGQTLVGPSPAPLTVLRVFEQRHGAAIIYLYELDAPELEFTHAYASLLIEQDRDTYVRGLFARIEQVWRDSDEDTAAFQEQLRAFGGQLLDELVPLELQRDLWDLRDRLAHIVVLSTEPFIPWELVHLKDPDAGQLPAETCFLAQLGLVRWLWQPQTSGHCGNVRLPERLRVRPGRARYVIPEYPDPAWCLPAAAAERAFLEQYLDAASVTPHHAEVLALLRDPSGPEGFDLLHFAGHGQAASDDIADAQLLLEGRMERGQYRLEPLRVTVVAQNFRVTSQPGPVVVLNACQAGRLGHQLAGIGGFAQAFLGGGASAFISSLWSVGDASAGVFVQVLYRRLLRGATMAEAVKRAREVARRCGDATWLAYTVYAHPGATLQRQVDPTPGSMSPGAK